MDKQTERKIRPFSSDDIAWTDLAEVPRFQARYKHLSLAALGETYRVGVAIEELLPGMQSSPAHYHMHEEEHVFLLEGELTVRLGGLRHAMKPGDYICFPAGQKSGHCLLNETAAVCRYVIIGEKDPDDVIVYTDTGKILVRALGRRAIFDLNATRGYWEGENTGLPNGQVLAEASGEIAETKSAPKPPIASGKVEWKQEHESTRFGGRSRHLTHAAVGDNYHVGVLIEAPDQGKRLAPKHYHMLEEEHALVLEGELTLLAGDAEYRMKPGDFVSFPAGLRIGHAFLNSGPGSASYLMIGERNPNEVCVYPDSNKMAVDALHGEEAIFDMSGRRGYWDGEEGD